MYSVILETKSDINFGFFCYVTQMCACQLITTTLMSHFIWLLNDREGAVHGTCGLNNLGTGPAEEVITGLEFPVDLPM